MKSNATKRSFLLISLIPFLIAGCMTTKITTPPVEVSFSSGTARDEVQRYIVLPSHTMIYNADGKSEQKDGVPCVVKGERFSVKYVSPANLRLPVFGPDTSDISMICTFQGEEKFENLESRNLTMEKISNSGASGGLIGAVVAITVASARGNRPNDEYSYETPLMYLNRRPPTADRSS